MSNTSNQNVLSEKNTTNIIQNKFPMKDLERVAQGMTFFVQSLFSKKIELVSKDLENQELAILNSKNQEIKKQEFFKFREAIFNEYPNLKKDSLTVTSKELKKILSAYLKESLNTLSTDQIRKLKFKISQLVLMEQQEIKLEDDFTLEASKKKVEALVQDQTELDQEFSLEKKIEILKKLIPVLDKNIDSINTLNQDEISKRININLCAKKRKETIDTELKNLKLELLDEESASEEDKKINDFIKCFIFPLCFFQNAPDEWKIDRTNNNFREYLVHLIQISHNKKTEESDELYKQFSNLSGKLENSVSRINFLNNSDIDHCKRFTLPNISYLLRSSGFNETLRSLPDKKGLGLINDLRNRDKDIQENISGLLRDSDFNRTLSSLPDKGLELINDLLNREKDIPKNISYLLRDSDFNETLSSLPDKGLELINDLLNREKDIPKNISDLLGSYGFDQFLQSLPDKGLGLINDLLNRDNDIPKNISDLLGSYGFNQFLQSLPDKGLGLINDLLNRDKDIQENISGLLRDSDFNETLRSLPHKGLGLINDLLNRDKDIPKNISYLLRDIDFNQTLMSLPDKGLGLINNLLNRKDDISNDSYIRLINRLIKIDPKDSAENKLDQIYNILGIEKTQKPQTELEIDSTEGQTAKKDNRISQ